MAIDVTAETDKIQKDFLANKEAVIKAVLQNPDAFVLSSAELIGVPIHYVAKLVAHGAASIIRDLAMNELKRRIETEPAPQMGN